MNSPIDSVKIQTAAGRFGIRPQSGLTRPTRAHASAMSSVLSVAQSSVYSQSWLNSRSHDGDGCQGPPKPDGEWKFMKPDGTGYATRTPPTRRASNRQP